MRKHLAGCCIFNNSGPDLRCFPVLTIESTRNRVYPDSVCHDRSKSTSSQNKPSLKRVNFFAKKGHITSGLGMNSSGDQPKSNLSGTLYTARKIKPNPSKDGDGKPRALNMGSRVPLLRGFPAFG